MNPQNQAGVPAQAAPAPAPQPVQHHAAPAAKKISKSELVNALKYLGASITKPFQTFKSSPEVDKPKFAFILAAIVAVSLTLLNIIAIIFSSIVTKTGKGKTEIVWKALQRAEFLPVIFKYLALFAGLLLAIGGIFYLANLVAKRQVTFGRFLSVAVTAALPYLLCKVLKSIVATITYAATDYSDLKAGETPFGSYVASAIGVIGLVYSIVIAVSLINNEMSFDDKGTALYFSSISLAIALVAANIVIPKVETSIAKDMVSKPITVKYNGEKYDCSDPEIDRDDFDNYSDYSEAIGKIAEKCVDALK